jgi:hypothetical protein
MDGVAVLRALLSADTELVALVPAERIVAGALPVATSLGAISITSISRVDRNIAAPGATRHCIERVQVMALAATYPAVKAILRAAKAAAADFIGSSSGLSNVTVHTDSAGPDGMDEQSSIHMQSQDFIVGFTETR